MNSPFTTVSEQIGLREFHPDDQEAVLVYRSDPDVKKFDTFGVNSAAAVKAILAKAATWADEVLRTHYFGAVYDLSTNRLIGEYALHLSPEALSGEVGIMLNPSQWGRGLAGDVLNQLQDVAIALGLHHLTARCHRDNLQAQKMLTKFGMTPVSETGETMNWSKVIQPSSDIP